MNRQEFQSRLLAFTKKSLTWCTDESERSTSMVLHAVECLLKDTKRVATLSDASLDAIKTLKKCLTVDTSHDQTMPVESIVDTLKELANSHEEINSVIQPVIHSLQFQDRLRQNLENLTKMLPHWLNYRQEIQDGKKRTDQDVINFANTLMKETTMKSERDVIRQHFEGVAEEVEAQAVNFF